MVWLRWGFPAWLNHPKLVRARVKRRQGGASGRPRAPWLGVPNVTRMHLLGMLLLVDVSRYCERMIQDRIGKCGTYELHAHVFRAGYLDWRSWQQLFGAAIAEWVALIYRSIDRPQLCNSICIYDAWNLSNSWASMSHLQVNWCTINSHIKLIWMYVPCMPYAKKLEKKRKWNASCFVGKSSVLIADEIHCRRYFFFGKIDPVIVMSLNSLSTITAKLSTSLEN